MPREWQDGNPGQRPPSHPLFLSVTLLSFFFFYSRLLFSFWPLSFSECVSGSPAFLSLLYTQELGCGCVSVCMCVLSKYPFTGKYVCVPFFLRKWVSGFMKSIHLHHSDKYRWHCIVEQNVNRTHRLTWWNFWPIYSIRSKVNDVEVVRSPLCHVLTVIRGIWVRPVMITDATL